MSLELNFNPLNQSSVYKPQDCEVQVITYSGWREMAVLDPNAIYPEYGHGPIQLPKVIKFKTQYEHKNKPLKVKSFLL